MPKLEDAKNPKLAGSTVLVSGGGGFIGSHLVHRLAALKVGKLLVLDNFHFGAKDNLVGLPPQAQIVSFDLGVDNPSTLKEILKGVEYVFHLAAEKHNQSLDTPYSLLASNVAGTYALYDAAERSGVRKVIFSSSLYAYGRMAHTPTLETAQADPRTLYGITKLFGEQALHHFGQKGTVQYNILRYFFTYGPRQYAGMGYRSVIVKNFERLLSGSPPVIRGDGNQVLDYVYVDDVVDATLLSLDSEVTGEVFNIGSGKATSIRELIRTMLEVAGAQRDPEYSEADETAGTYRVGNVEKARRLLGWQPQIGLKEGLTRTLDWMKAERMRHGI